MVVFTGSTVEEAIQIGLKELDIPRMKAHIVVIAREKNVWFGLLGKKPAEVDIEPISEITVVKANQQAVKGVPEEVNLKNEPVKSVKEETVDLGSVVAAIKKIEEKGEEISQEVKDEILKNDKKADTILEETGTIELLKDSDLVSHLSKEEGKTNTKQDETSFSEDEYREDEVRAIAECVMAYVQQIVSKMGVECTIVSHVNRRAVQLQIDTSDPARMIGYHGKILKALQLLAQHYLYHQHSSAIFLSINVNNYTEHRTEVLQHYAQKLAYKVLETGVAERTDALSNSERKVIHHTIAKMEQLTSYSEGEEPNRCVVIASADTV